MLAALSVCTRITFFFFLQMRELFCPPRACSQLMEVCMSRLQVFYQGQHLLKVLFQH